MTKSLMLGAILGGLTAFIWSSISWEVLGWHEKPMLAFQNEDEVAAVIASHAPQSGIYVLPGAPAAGLTAEQKKSAQAAQIAKMQKGPIVFAAVRTGGFGSYARGLIIQILSLMAAALLLTWLLLQTTGLSYARRVIFLAVVGLAASVIVDLPNWNWWGFSGIYTLVNLADFTLMWLFAGFVIARVAKPRIA
ncbi:MAG TPA: hypothetical protein VN861_18705 [Candidatus Acidoferrales bacterium]|nr:hypothetical protein [Candidatus Acidoferrales bacterium]